jgi:hypothetical protein
MSSRKPNSQKGESMDSTNQALEKLTLIIQQEIQVRASLQITFAALLEQLGPQNEVAEGRPMPMKLEPWPGGRWFRDLGEGNGHFWGLVQAIKRPTLLEITGPLFMSYPAISNLQYRLSEVANGTLIKFRHYAMGLIPDDDKKNVSGGWGYTHNLLKLKLEKLQLH